MTRSKQLSTTTTTDEEKEEEAGDEKTARKLLQDETTPTRKTRYKYQRANYDSPPLSHHTSSQGQLVRPVPGSVQPIVSIRQVSRERDSFLFYLLVPLPRSFVAKWGGTLVFRHTPVVPCFAVLYPSTFSPPGRTSARAYIGAVIRVLKYTAR